ncbi:PH and SEC7 domain-containing protein 4-like [Carettochelys insculpta]|uniref:PH and SEC7 domain-containing protein 4-like n=1 Tax=Carettochelys insculpta TaxID=44489 RepID=UPI003EB9D4DB
MDPARPPDRTEHMDLLTPCAVTTLGCRPAEGLIRVQDAIVFSDNYPHGASALHARTPLGPAGPSIGSCFLPVATGEHERSGEEFPSVAGLAGGMGSPWASEVPTLEFPPPPEEVLQVENLNARAEGKKDPQALFWAGFLQAQLCVQDLQEELEKQGERSSWPPAPEAAAQSLQAGEPLDDSDEGQEAGPGRQEEEEEEEEGSLSPAEEEDHLFYDNPLFQDSPRLAGSSPLWSAGEMGSAAPGEGAPEGPPWGPTATAEPEPGAEAEVPTYTLHCSSWAPLLITEGDIARARPMAEDPEAMPPEQLVDRAVSHPLVLLESEESGLGGSEDPAESGLLFSPSSTSVISALLEGDDSAHPSPCEAHPTSSAPASSSCSPPLPTHPTAEPVQPQATDLGLPAPGRGSPVPPGTLAEPSRSASSPQGGNTKTESPHESLDLEEGEPGSALEGQELDDGPPLLGDEPAQGKEETPELTPRCPGEEHAREKPGLLEEGQPDGAILANGASGDEGAAQRLAARLYHLDGFKRSQVASYLRKNNEFSRQVAEEYLAFFQFSGQTLDRALRSFLKVLVLTGETQERERILGHFSRRYHLSNPDAFPSADAVHTLTCSLMLLNTDLHGQNIGRSMTCHEFVTNLDGMRDGENFPKEQLKALYYSIRNEKLEWAVDEEELVSGLPPRPPSTPSSRKKSNPFLTLTHDAKAATYKQGLLARKVHAEADGKKTPWGKRGWKTFHTVLKGMVLYFLKDESQVEAGGTEEPIGVHHALAERAYKYHKRPHVFRLQTADWRIVLFQAMSAEEMNSWISRINLVAAMFSSPPFPAAVGSRSKFVRPVLPTAQCRSSLEEQHQAHEMWMDKFTDDLGEHQRNLPDKRGRGRDLEEYRIKKEYLLYEKRRYETYVKLLEARLHGGPEELEQWEARLGGPDSADDGLGLTKSHSSPSLNVDPPAAGVKVKRNISERRTVRKIIPKRNKQLL